MLEYGTIVCARKGDEARSTAPGADREGHICRKEHFLKIYLGNLGNIDDAGLSELVTPFGKPTSSTVAKDRSSGESKGFGFVEFGSADEAKAAIAGLNGKEVGGKMLKVSEAKSQTPDKGRS